ncbi:MAG: D-alanyl-D-alanine carboxypeptidase [Verrucomicrobiae bacterium]|nr:D-alanyl-D-alanine carboxypeptidase [Verrucomicrobiae bacterium]
MSGNAQANNPFIVVDANHKKILIQNEADRKVPVASLTKVATVLVSLDWVYSKGGDKNATMVVPPSAGMIGGANPLGMQPGDQVTVRDAVYACMLASDNVSAETLADYFGRQMLRYVGGNDPLSAFVGQMNALAASLGMSETKFVNPHGLDHQGKFGTSTARDMARLMIYGLRNPSFNFIVAQTSRDITYQRGGQPLGFTINNTNQLLGKYGVDGGKTGSTRRAGDCLITTARKPDRFVPINESQKRRIPYRLVTVVLGSPDRFGQTAGLIQQGWATYDGWISGGMKVTTPGEILKVGNSTTEP